MVTFTTLAESKCWEALSEHVRPTAGASTATATEETRPRRAAWMSPLILAASAGCDEERQIADAAEADRASTGISNAATRITPTILDNFAHAPSGPPRKRSETN